MLALNAILLLHPLVSASCTDPKTSTVTIPTKPSAATNANVTAEANTLTWIILQKKVIVSSYGLKHFPLLALNPVPPPEHPLASASCAVSMTSTATTVTSPSAVNTAKQYDS
jgi:hypothetical protein